MKPKYLVRGAYSFDEAANSNESTHTEWEPSKTQQSQAEEADINTIVKRFGLTGTLPDSNRLPTYGDYSDVYDYKSAMDAIAAAQSSFNEMPAHIRSRFENDPQKLLEWVHDPNRTAADFEAAGLARAKANTEAQAATAGSTPGGTTREPAKGASAPTTVTT